MKTITVSFASPSPVFGRSSRDTQTCQLNYPFQSSTTPGVKHNGRGSDKSGPDFSQVNVLSRIIPCRLWISPLLRWCKSTQLASDLPKTCGELLPDQQSLISTKVLFHTKSVQMKEIRMVGKVGTHALHAHSRLHASSILYDRVSTQTFTRQ